MAKKTKGVPSYFGGTLTTRQKAAHERRLKELYEQAKRFRRDGETAMFLHTYEKFVAFCAVQRPPYATGSQKTDQRFLGAVGLAGEAGEINNKVKKLMFRQKVGSKSLSVEQRAMLMSEDGGMLWYFIAHLQSFGLGLFDVIDFNMRKVVERGR